MTERPRVLGITLARGGSKSVRLKNVRPILGIPLLAYTVAEALRSRWMTRYLISTDHEEIARVAREYGAEAPFLRPAELATDTASSVSALQHAVEWAERDEGVRYDYVVDVMCTNPLKTAADIDAVVEKLVTSGADSVIAVHKLDDHHPARIKKIVHDRIVDFCVPEMPESRRQDLKPDAYIRSGAIYGLRRDHLMIDGRRYGSSDSRPYILPPERAINVDAEIDFLMAETMLAGAPRTYIERVTASL